MSRLAEPALRHADVAEHERASDGVRGVAAFPHHGERVGERAVRRIQLTASPMRERNERGTGRARSGVPRGAELERALRMRERPWNSAERLREVDARGGDFGAQRPNAFLIARTRGR